ncbi:hypothetical protein L6452_36351 [Arctium lappa]|uniref:Uncharacterized protein n=1 Tax=Arctium lappa TaxID=4217 RepID=A0ACB8Y885_ARCLA|nr:hypothetical protein L6452_36351 [Arctium lappa]
MPYVREKIEFSEPGSEERLCPATVTGSLLLRAQSQGHGDSRFSSSSNKVLEARTKITSSSSPPSNLLGFNATIITILKIESLWIILVT